MARAARTAFIDITRPRPQIRDTQIRADPQPDRTASPRHRFGHARIGGALDDTRGRVPSQAGARESAGRVDAPGVRI